LDVAEVLGLLLTGLAGVACVVLLRAVLHVIRHWRTARDIIDDS